MAADLLGLDSLLVFYGNLFRWLGTLTIWMSGLLIALSSLGAAVYLLLLFSGDRRQHWLQGRHY